MRLLSIDPAGKSNRVGRGYAVIELEHESIWGRAGAKPFLLGWFSGDLPDGRALQWGPLDLIAVEAQYPGEKSGKQSLITLGFGAGFLAGYAAGAGATRCIAVPVRDWKEALIPGFANAKKEMYTKNLAQMWPAVKNEHCLDAVGMGMTVARGCFPEKLLRSWEVR